MRMWKWLAEPDLEDPCVGPKHMISILTDYFDQLLKNLPTSYSGEPKKRPYECVYTHFYKKLAITDRGVGHRKINAKVDLQVTSK